MEASDGILLEYVKRVGAFVLYLQGDLEAGEQVQLLKLDHERRPALLLAMTIGAVASDETPQ